MKTVTVPLLIAAASVAALVSTAGRAPRVAVRSGPAASRYTRYVAIPPGASLDSVVDKASKVVPSANQLAWQRREFIGFAHFGMNTFTDREWGDGKESPALFDPSDFDARQWARIFAGAGMRMLILTAKHHDGFCLWPTATTAHSVRHSPWKQGRGDVVAEVARACREAGLAFGIYVSPWDRHEPSYGDSPRYDAVFRAQLRELLTGYGEIAEVWFDGANGEGPNGKRQVYDWPSYYRVVRELQPQAVIFGMAPDVRWVGTESGYGRETEWSVIPLRLADAARIRPDSPHPLDDAFAPGDLRATDLGSREAIRSATVLAWYPAETDVSIRPGWFYHAAEDARVKAPETLVDIYLSSVGRNGVLLLNVPPDRRGRIADADAGSLAGLRRILDRTFGPSAPPRAPAPARRLAGALASYEVAAPTADFNLAVLQEDIEQGQRVEAFRLEACTEGACREIARATTIGYKRILRFAPARAERVRLVVEQARGTPVLAGFSLHTLAP
ncbi:MAG TPA: alpha-L-fucosidase [Vicinamibacterales bacterium]|nr:alpha-L-fucosidase [Vicinamibacterales bacterium]